MDYKNVAEEVLTALGGKENLKSLTYCATRLRFSLYDRSKLDKDAIEKNPSFLGFVDNNGNYQLIIGTDVPHVYDAITDMTGDFSSEKKNGSEENSESDKGSLLDRFLATISAIFTPYIPVLATSGIMIGLVAIAAELGWVTEESTTYITFDAIGYALINFFPILLAFTAANRFGANPYVGATIGAALMYPNLSDILVSGESLTLLGIPFTAMNFANTVIPIIVAMWAFSYIEKFLKKFLAKPLQFMLVPLFSMLSMVPLTLLVFGPIGNVLAQGIANAYQFMVDGNLFVLSLVSGMFFIFIIMLGLHWILLPIQLQILADQGFEYSLAAGGMGGYALLGITLAVLLFNKDKKLKEVAGSAAFVNMISGVTEPGLYGICMQNKRYFLALILGGATGGIICGIFQVYVKAFAFGGILGMPAFAAATEVFPYYLLSMFSSIAVGFIVTFFIEKRKIAKDLKYFKDAA